MCKTARNPQLPVCLIIKNDGNMAPECWTSHPDIDGDVENGPSQNHDQLALLIWILKVKPPQTGLAGCGKVVLNEVAMEASFMILTVIEDFEKIPSGISK